MAKKVNTGKIVAGVVLTGVGAFLASPADEAIVTGATLGAGAAAAPVQLPATGAIGGLMIVTGMGLIVDGLGK
jgi:hypothetical protein